MPIADQDGRDDPFAAVMEFHRQFQVPIGSRPAFPEMPVIALRLDLIREEYHELEMAIGDEDIAEVADALADLVYVTYGAAIAFGIDLRPVFAEVHRANMRKSRDFRRPDGKILKPEGWQGPLLRPLLDRMRLVPATEEEEDRNADR